MKQRIDIGNFKELNFFLSQFSKGYRPKKARTFSKQNIEDFMCNAPDEIYLVEKVNTNYIYIGTCRSEIKRVVSRFILGR